MPRRAHAFRTFARHFARNVLFVREVLAGLLLLLILGGITISRLETIDLDQAIYFSFITGLSIGYGDIVPHTFWGQLASVAIGLIGMIFTGITVAIATRALADSVKDHRAG